MPLRNEFVGLRERVLGTSGVSREHHYARSLRRFYAVLRGEVALEQCAQDQRGVRGNETSYGDKAWTASDGCNKRHFAVATSLCPWLGEAAGSVAPEQRLDCYPSAKWSKASLDDRKSFALVSFIAPSPQTNRSLIGFTMIPGTLVRRSVVFLSSSLFHLRHHLDSRNERQLATVPCMAKKNLIFISILRIAVRTPDNEQGPP